ncbi:MAG: hypothetical protein ACXWCV_13830 [Caldimonas sp.]
MSSLKELRWGKAPAPMAGARRHLAAALLQSASALLARLAASLASEPAPAVLDPRFEFHAEAGAPEGALYVDGRFVGWLSGVSRL